METALKIIPLIFATFGGIWAILTYRKSNKIKAAEIFYNLENNFRQHISILLEIEYEKDYQDKIVRAIHSVENNSTKKEDDETIEKLDGMLRHFHTCFFIKKLRVDNGMLDDAYAYYLKLFVRKDRTELERYVAKYWKSVYSWASFYK